MIDRRDGTLMLYGGYAYAPSDYGAAEDIWIFHKTTKLWKIAAGNWTAINSLPNYENFRVGEATIGSRAYFAAASELTNRGNFIILGGETDDVCCFSDIWVFDQDECAVGTHTCDPNAQCTNALTGYTCACKSGYSGDGFTCTAVITPTFNMPTPKSTSMATNVQWSVTSAVLYGLFISLA